MVRKQVMAVLLACMLVIVAACGNNGNTGNTAGSTPQNTGSSDAGGGAASPKPERTEVSFWYLWGGTEGEYVEQLIAEFNGSQELYTVVGLSVPDEQKITVAISGGDGPDVTDTFSDRTANYASKGMLLALDDYIARDSYDLSDFVPAALAGGQFEGKQYALPININFFMLFYNKALFAEAGLSAPPASADELLEYAIKLTTLNDNQTIDTLGFPDFPFVYYPNNMTYSLGGDLISADGAELTPDNPGTVAAIKLMQAYREQFGVDNVLKFNASAKYLDVTDPFIMGKQAMRIDGPWFGHTITNVLKKDIDYGVAPLPGGGGEVSSSTFYIPSNAKNKDGAWAFLSWLMSKENMTKFNDMFANLPARTSVYDDPSLQDIPDFQAFAQAATSPKLKSFPVFEAQGEYGKLLIDEIELAVNGKKSAEDAVKAVKEKSANLLK